MDIENKNKHSKTFEHALKAVEAVGEEADVILVPKKPSDKLLKRTAALTGLSKNTLKYIYETMIKLSHDGY